ncbi:hypothetical protein DITRI_Ditri06bG0151800 [Diplodiscus trichospermus]
MSSSGLQLSNLTSERFQSTIDKINRDASSIISLTLQWKQVENHYTSIGNSIDDRSKELHSIEQTIKQRLGELKLREEKLSVEQFAIKQRFEDLERREKEFELMRRSGTSQKEIDRMQRFIEELEVAKLGFEEGLRKLDLREKTMLSMAQERFDHQAKLEKMERELGAKEKRFAELVKEYGFGEELFSSEAREKRSSPCTRSKSRNLQHCALIQNLVEKDCRLQAIKYVCELNMADRFSPATLLQDHLMYVKKIAREREQKDYSVPVQIVAITKEIADLKAAIKCVKLYQIEADFNSSKIQKSIGKLEMKKAELKKFGPRTRSKSKILHQASDQETSDAISTAKQSQQHEQECSREKRARIT